MGVVEGLPAQTDKFGWILPQFLTDRKQLLEALGHGLYGSIVKRSLQKIVQILYKNSRSDQRGEGGHTIAPSPEYATVWKCSVHHESGLLLSGENIATERNFVEKRANKINKIK